MFCVDREDRDAENIQNKHYDSRMCSCMLLRFKIFGNHVITENVYRNQKILSNSNSVFWQYRSPVIP